MSVELRSYLSGTWQQGAASGAAVLLNPANEEELATSSTEGLDFEAALTFARDVGGTALRALGFAARGELVRAASRVIHAHRDELIGLAVANGGNTRGDAKFDIDGAIGTLAAYADLAAGLGTGTTLVDGPGVQLGRGARLFGAHVLVPRRGVAVHINAFNFPAWGMCEKAAMAWLAGMPVVSKPATSTALVAHRIAEILVAEAGLPAGAFSFVAGNAGNLLDHLEGQDVLAFTGSGDTGAALRRGERVLARSVRVNVEADSLNAAVLGPGVDDGSDLLNLFLGDVVRDMTQKTGQKCTAIRRVYVPSDRLEAVIALLGERLSTVKVGDPAHEGVNMGPLATRKQLKDVRAGVERLAACGRVVVGGPEPLDGLGVPPGKGFFLRPTLVRVDTPRPGDAVHEHEVFGPVATVMPYDGTAAGAVALVAAGGGGLVSSVYADDKAFLREVVLGMAPFHGRVTVGTSKLVGQAVPPGMVLPQLIHGGPGRAGGGEELGGVRGLSFYMQRVALQGDRALIEAISG